MFIRGMTYSYSIRYVLTDAHFLLQHKRKHFLYIMGPWDAPDPCAGISEPLSWLGTKQKLGCITAPPGYRMAESITGLLKSLEICTASSKINIRFVLSTLCRTPRQTSYGATGIFSRIFFKKIIKSKSNEAALRRQRPVLPVNEPKKTGARCADKPAS